MTERKNTSGTMHRDYILGVYPERSRRKPALETGNAFFASRMDLRDYYAYVRYYHPRLGRFMSPDPLAGNVGNPQSLNSYTYVLNNPETFIDPPGLRCGSDTLKEYSDDGFGKHLLGASLWFFDDCSTGSRFPGSSAGGGTELPEWGWNGSTFMPNAHEYSFALKFAAKLILAKLRASPNAGQSPQSHPPQDQNGWWHPAPREGTYGEWLACEANDVLSHPDKLEVEGAVTVAPMPLAATGQEAKAWVGLGLAAVLDWGSAISTNVKCEREVNYHPSW